MSPTTTSITNTKKSLRILVTPLNNHGHINACHGLCEELRDRGHEVIFVLQDKSFANRLTRYGFKERIISLPPKTDDDEVSLPECVKRNAKRYNNPPLVQLGDVLLQAYTIMKKQQDRMAHAYKSTIDELKPDLIIYDGYICFPTIVNSSVPWIWLYSAAPNGMLHDSRIPPFYSGFSITSDKTEWVDYFAKATKAIEPLWKAVSDTNVAQGGEPLPYGRLHPFSKFLNLFMQPKELRYTELTDLPHNIVAVDCFVRTVPDVTFELPAQLKDKPGKLIFFSMGSVGCCPLELMTRLVGTLAKSSHRFIISKGPLQYELPGENLWGEPFLPQTAILPLVDLVVTHGGNNTVTETFFYGKPILVLPLFGDQFDNAQRITEVSLGARLNPYNCTEEELLQTIDRLVFDQELARKMDAIGKRIRSSNDKQKVADLIEQKFGI